MWQGTVRSGKAQNPILVTVTRAIQRAENIEAATYPRALREVAVLAVTRSERHVQVHRPFSQNRPNYGPCYQDK